MTSYRTLRPDAEGLRMSPHKLAKEAFNEAHLAEPSAVADDEARTVTIVRGSRAELERTLMTRFPGYKIIE